MVSKITRTGNAVSVVYNDAADRYTHYTVNVNSGLFVGIKKAGGIESNALGQKPKEFPHNAVEEVAGEAPSGETDDEKTLDVYNKLSALLQ